MISHEQIRLESKKERCEQLIKELKKICCRKTYSIIADSIIELIDNCHRDRTLAQIFMITFMFEDKIPSKEVIRIHGILFDLQKLD